MDNNTNGNQEMCEEIDQLRALTEKLPRFSSLIQESNDCMTTYKSDTGTIIGFKLHSSDQVVVMRVFLSKGASMKEHIHDASKETYHLVSGIFEVHYSKSKKTMMPGDIFTIPNKTAHKTRAVEDCWIVLVAIPRGDGYPR